MFELDVSENTNVPAMVVAETNSRCLLQLILIRRIDVHIFHLLIDLCNSTETVLITMCRIVDVLVTILELRIVATT